MKRISDLVPKKQKRPAKRTRETERGELMRHFVKNLNRTRPRAGLPPVTMSRMGKILEGLPTKDLYYLKRVCDDASVSARARDRSGPDAFSKRFWWEIDPKKHDDEA